MIALAITLAVMCPLAIGAAWMWEAHRLALLNRRVHGHKPITPTSHDAQALSDAQLQAEWRRRVQENIERRAKAKPLPSLLRRQAE